MKHISVLLFALLELWCNQQANHSQTDKISVLEYRIDSLENALANTYKPGFGEIMSRIQANHAKLWFAGLYQNWQLADFEVHEIKEGIENIGIYQINREESALIEMINPALDSVSLAVKNQDLQAFKRSYTLLTRDCNECHRETKFEFNIVKTPSSQTFSNQGF